MLLSCDACLDIPDPLSFVQPPKNTPDVVQDADWDDAMNASREELDDALDMF